MIDAQAQLRQQVLDLLRLEGRAIHTGRIATQLGTTTSAVHNVMHHPLQLGQVWFASSEGYSLPTRDTSVPPDESQQRLA